ncbi:CbtA family protein [Silvibacterium acidisoli]|uniref:CbtA family protein n=1 Tax=Acidobacteriaceae bacterium ZG23-2 TaxID=2883246 RepID=UPI00406C4445
MTRILLVRGMLAGLVAGLFVFALARWIGEPQVERAIAFETVMDHARGEAPEAEVVSRKVQGTLGLLTATVLDGTAVGGIFALAFTFAMGRLPVQSPRNLAALLAALGFVAIAIVPALKYPANPPSVGNPDTIGIRTAAYFLLLAFSCALTALSVQVAMRFHRRLGAWNASLLSIGFFVVAATVTCHYFPDFDEVPAGFPVTLMWKFRVASLAMQALLWSVLGVVFGWFVEKVVARRSTHG